MMLGGAQGSSVILEVGPSQYFFCFCFFLTPIYCPQVCNYDGHMTWTILHKQDSDWSMEALTTCKCTEMWGAWREGSVKSCALSVSQCETLSAFNFLNKPNNNSKFPTVLHSQAYQARGPICLLLQLGYTCQTRTSWSRHRSHRCAMWMARLPPSKQMWLDRCWLW